MYYVLVVGVVALISIHYASLSEWALHRYVMHRAFLGFAYPYIAHDRTHHRLFRADDSYHIDHPAKKEKIAMAWWNGAVIVVLGGVPFYPTFFFTSWLDALVVVLTSLLMFAAYYAVYERLHWLMHDPKDRLTERTWIFRWLNAHHLLHHQEMRGCNFNVVLPLADWIFRTLRFRANISFAQVRGAAVPDVQPRVLAAE